MSAADYKEEGNRLFLEKRWKEAIEQYSKGLEHSEAALEADKRGLLQSNRSQCWLNLEEWQKALEDADACLKQLPEHVKSIFRRAVAYEKLGKAKEALADYVRVAKVEPQNRAAVAGAQRLRDELMRLGDQRLGEALPGHLLEVLRNHAASSSEVVDACSKLRSLCVHRGCTGSLLSAGAVDLLLEKASSAETPLEVREAAMAMLFTMASGHEANEDEDEGTRHLARTSGPLPVATAVGEVRKKLYSCLLIGAFREQCRGHAKPTRYLALILGYTHEPEDTEALEAIHDALAFTEEGEVNVPQAGIIALASMLDARRRLGKLGKPLMPTGGLLKCLESALGCSCAQPVQSLMAAAFALLADTDRPKAQEVDLADVGLRVLEPFLQSNDWGLKANGLAGFSALLAANAKAAAQLLQQSPAPLVAVLAAIKRPPPGPEGLAARDHAAECMLLATGDQKTRQCLIESDGIDILLGALGDGEEGSRGLMRAKLVAVLAIIAGHNKEVREEVFDRLDFFLELRDALEKARESASAARAGGPGAPSIEQSRRLCCGLYESCACLTIHGEFKEQLVASKRTLKAMQDLLRPEDLADDPQLSFLYTSIIYNICRSREDKVRPKKNEFPFNELDEDDLNAIEEFYDKMPAESRPVKNGEVDPGSRELADQLRAWCALQSGDSARGPGSGAGAPGTGSNVVTHLGKCVANGSARVKSLIALALRYMCAEQGHRRYVVLGGGVRVLLGLVDLEEETAQDAARQALAQILIVTNPTLLQYSEQLDAVRPLVQLLEHRHELLQFESAMGLTNLLTVGDELRTRAVQGDAWRACRDLLFCENELVQRAGLEAMCNLTMASEVMERFATGRAELEIKVFIGFCHATDQASRVAASGALAMLASCEEVAVRIAASDNFAELLEATLEAEDADIQHRLVSVLCGICEAQESPAEVVGRTRSALRERRSRGLASREARALAGGVLDEAAVSMGGA